MKNLACISLAVFLITVGFAFQKAWSVDLLTRDQAISILIEQVIKPSPNKDTLMAIGPQNMMVDGDIVEPSHIGGEIYPGNRRTIGSPTWFFWVDDEPDKLFVHPTRFVYIDAAHTNPSIGDGIIVEIQGWWPKINGIETYDYPPGNSHPDLVYGTVPTK